VNRGRPPRMLEFFSTCFVALFGVLVVSPLVVEVHLSTTSVSSESTLNLFTWILTYRYSRHYLDHSLVTTMFLPTSL